MDKMLSEFGIGDSTRLKCDDFLQEYNIVVNIAAVEKLPEEKEFEMMGDISELQAKLEKDNNEKAANGTSAANNTGTATHVVYCLTIS